MHSELRQLLEQQLGPQPLPGSIYRPGNWMRGQVSVPYTESPPFEIFFGALGLVFLLPLAIGEATGRQEPILLVLVALPLAIAAILFVRGLIRIRWWWRARRIALQWCAEHGHVMPHDLRW